MPFSISPVQGANLNNTVLAAEATARPEQIPAKLGTQVWGDDGKLYVFARANATISANTAVCTVSPTTFLATAAGGTYASPAVAMATNDYGWFGKASV